LIHDFQVTRRSGLCPALLFQYSFDPHESKNDANKVFSSQAHSGHIGEHREVILTEPTARFGGRRLEHILEFGKPATFETDELHTLRYPQTDLLRRFGE